MEDTVARAQKDLDPREDEATTMSYGSALLDSKGYIEGVPGKQPRQYRCPEPRIVASG
jgi:hypothetical protein